MKASFISDLHIGNEIVNEPFLLQDLTFRTTKDGRPFLLFSLRDKTGVMNGVFWDVPDYVENWIKNNIVVLVTGRIMQYKDALQANVTDLNVSTAHNMRDYLLSSTRPHDEMIEELTGRISRLQEPWQKLTRYILLDEAFLQQFAAAPAARQMHHAYIGGLLEHSLSMAELADVLADHYPYVNRDLLTAGALLHDLGKVTEFDTEGGITYSEDGRLVGHIVRAIVIVEKAAAELGDIAEADLRDLIHLIASHHGQPEWGSPVIPKTLEALLLHQIDLLDSRVQGFYEHIRNDAGDEAWTLQRSLMFNTNLRRPQGFDD